MYIGVEALNGPTTSIVELAVEIDGKEFVFTGDSKCHPNDDPNPMIGEAYALSRAAQKVAVAFQAWADDQVGRAAARRWLADLTKTEPDNPVTEWDLKQITIEKM